MEEPESCTCVLDSSIYHPEYNLRINIQEDKYFVNPLYAYILMVTFDDYSTASNDDSDQQTLPSSHCSILGFSLINIYKDVEPNPDNAEEHHEDDWDVNEGDWELPIL